MTTRFEDLTRRMRSLPGRRRREAHIGKLTRYTTDVQKVAENFGELAETGREIREAFPAVTLQSVTGAIERGALLAAKLKVLLQNDPDSVDTPEADEIVISLKGQAQFAKTALRDQWRTQLTQVIGRYEKLIAAANKIHLQGTQVLVDAIVRIRQQSLVDPISDKVRIVRRDIELLRSSVRDLHLEGKGGRFLEQVVDNNGNPTELADPEIRAFLDAHKLWPDIVVVLR